MELVKDIKVAVMESINGLHSQIGESCIEKVINRFPWDKLWDTYAVLTSSTR